MAIDPRFSVLVSGYTFLESPRWHNDRLWLSDFYTHQVVRVDLQGQVDKVADVPGQPSGMGWLPDGRLLVVSMRDRKILRQEADGRLVTHADLSSVADGHANDMVVDAQGSARTAPRLAHRAQVPVNPASVARSPNSIANGTITTMKGKAWRIPRR